MKGFIDELGNTISKKGRMAVQKTRDISEMSKLNIDIAVEEDTINELYRNIGMKYYQQMCKNPSKEYEDLFLELEQSQTKIETYSEKITLIKGFRLCPQCGSQINAKAIFCSTCGLNIMQWKSENSN
ncbi:MAG: hypothetical protein ACRCST_15945 [Turicibacter sp.]